MISGSGPIKKVAKSIAKPVSKVASKASPYLPGIGKAVGAGLAIGGGLLAGKASPGVQDVSPEETGYFPSNAKSYENELASRAMTKPTTFQQPYKFNFAALPDKLKEDIYESDAKSIRREGEGQIEKLKENVGVRRPGILAKMTSKGQSSILEQLAELRRNAEIESMKQNIDLQKQQQLAQADEDYRADRNKTDILRQNTSDLENLFSTTSGLYSTSKGRAFEAKESRRKRAGDAYSSAAKTAGGFLSTLFDKKDGK